MKQDFNQFKELPAPLPVGERVIWQGKPSFKGLALRSFHIREVAIYLRPPDGVEAVVELVARRVARRGRYVRVVVGRPGHQRNRGPGRSRVAVPPAACYTITSKRVLFQFGVALPMTMNIPLSTIASAALQIYRDGSGDIPLALSDSERVSFAVLWPHVRPWQLPTPNRCCARAAGGDLSRVWRRR